MSLALRRALNQAMLPLFHEKGFTGKFPLMVRQRTELSDCMALQCDRHGRGMIILHLKCFDAASSPADLHRYGKALEADPVRGSTVSLRLFGPIKAYWFTYKLGQEQEFADQMKLWFPAIEQWFVTGEWDPQLLPESFRPKTELNGILSRVLCGLRRFNPFQKP